MYLRLYYAEFRAKAKGPPRGPGRGGALASPKGHDLAIQNDIISRPRFLFNSRVQSAQASPKWFWWLRSRMLRWRFESAIGAARVLYSPLILGSIAVPTEKPASRRAPRLASRPNEPKLPAIGLETPCFQLISSFQCYHSLLPALWVGSFLDFSASPEPTQDTCQGLTRAAGRDTF